MKPLLEVRGLTKRFGAVEALMDVDFEAGRSEVTALVGDNGAGKSTLIKIVSGILQADAGTIALDGGPVRIPTPQAAKELGIATVYQDLALCDNLDVVGNIFLGREDTIPGAPSVLSWIDEVAMERQTAELLRRLKVGIPSVRTEAGALSGGQRQSVAIARSMLGSPRLVLLDEPTAALGVAQTAEVLGLVRRLREEGIAVVLISHNLANVFAVADRITVLRLGRRVASFTSADTTREEVVAVITGAAPGTELAREGVAS
jgi:D-xylose transport system ATP-binding protein